VGTLAQGLSLPVDNNPKAAALKGVVALKLQLGLAGRWMEPPCISEDSQRQPELTRFLFAWLREDCPEAVATSCTVAFNRLAPLHCDRNLGPSYLTAVGAFTGGGLWVADGRRGRVLRTNGRWNTFSAAVPHRTLPFSGCRGYVTFYCDRSASRMSFKMRWPA
jgi:hypothetical protein